MKAVISVVGCDSVGIIAKVSNECADCGVNILDISQTVLQDYFTMIMITDIDKINIPFWERNFPWRSMPCMKIFLMPCTGSDAEREFFYAGQK